MRKLFTPVNGDVRQRHVHVSDVSKKQLVRVVNEQAATIQRLDQSVKSMGRVLLAIVRTPDALSIESGFVAVAGSALANITPGTQLVIEPGDDGVRLRVVEAAPVAVEVPIIIP